MKANGLNGEYCQNCASILDDVQHNHRRVIVLDSQCLAVFQQSGDAVRLDERVPKSATPLKDAVSAGVESVKKVFKHEEKKPEPKKAKGKK